MNPVHEHCSSQKKIEKNFFIKKIKNKNKIKQSKWDKILKIKKIKFSKIKIFLLIKMF